MARIVLVADDSPTIQKRALGILKNEGFEVETVSNGVAAIKRLAVLHPVLIIADVSMPGRDGYEVCDFVKKSPDLSHVPVLLLASDLEPYDEAKGTHVKADGIIKKPFEARELISLVLKFANRSGEETVRAPKLPDLAAPPSERTQEFTAFSESPDPVSSITPHIEPDFSAQSGGVAFSPTSGEGSDEFFSASHPHDLGAPVPSFLEGLGGERPEPVFIEEQTVLASEPRNDSAARTMIFRTPLDIADPVWKDDTVRTPPTYESVGHTASQPYAQSEAPVASAQTPAEQVAEFQFPPSGPATSLDSFSLDDAAAGHVQFVKNGVDVPSAEETTTMGIAPFAVAPKAANAGYVSSASEPEALCAELAPNQAPSGTVYAESVPFDSVPEAVHADAAGSEPGTGAPETAAPPPAFDWNLFYTVVRKVVVRMSPPVLPAEVVEAIARRLADEIAVEISSGSSPAKT